MIMKIKRMKGKVKKKNRENLAGLKKEIKKKLKFIFEQEKLKKRNSTIN